MRFGLLLALLAAAPLAAQPAMDRPADLDRWQLVYDQADATVFLDTGSLFAEADRVTAWTWWAFEEDQVYDGLAPFDRKMDKSIYDCAARATLLLETEDYDDGRLIDYWQDYDDQWDDWAEGSAAEVVGEAACGGTG